MAQLAAQPSSRSVLLLDQSSAGLPFNTALATASRLQTRVLRIKTKLGQSNTVHVSIKDTGAGIKQSDIARLFQPMFTTKTRGMGMGLSICQSIIENHDGRICSRS
jgi:signal transduction histidine kinase